LAQGILAQASLVQTVALALGGISTGTGLDTGRLDGSLPCSMDDMRSYPPDVERGDGGVRASRRG